MRRVPRTVLVGVAALAALTAVGCTNEKVPATPAITGTMPGSGSGSTLPTLGPDTIPTTSTVPGATGTTPGTARP